MRPVSLSSAALLLLSAILPAEGGEPIRLHPENPHYFLFRGKITPLITSGEHYGAVLNADFDYKRYLATLAADRLNYTRVFGGSYVEVPEKSFGIARNTLAPQPGRYLAPWARSGTPGYAGGGDKFDLRRWNPAYFTRYREVLTEAARLGIVVEVTLFSSTYGELQWTASPFHPANNVNGTELADWKKLHTLENGGILEVQERYVRQLVREANAFDNVIFEIQNEPWSDRPVLADAVNPYLQRSSRDAYPNSVDLADEPSLSWQARVAEWILSEESGLPNRHLIAQNYCNFRFPVRRLVPGAAIVNFHYAYPEAAVENYGLGAALAYDETGFLGSDDALYRRQAWNFLLSGGGAFDGLDYSFSAGREDGSDTAPNGPGGGSPALRRQLSVLRQFLERFDLVALRPDPRTVGHVGGAVARVLASPGREYAIYLDGSGPAELSLELPAGDYSGEWVNVVSGEIERRERFSHRGGARTLASPRFSNGVALRLARD